MSIRSHIKFFVGVTGHYNNSKELQKAILASPFGNKIAQESCKTTVGRGIYITDDASPEEYIYYVSHNWGRKFLEYTTCPSCYRLEELKFKQEAPCVQNTTLFGSSDSTKHNSLEKKILTAFTYYI